MWRRQHESEPPKGLEATHLTRALDSCAIFLKGLKKERILKIQASLTAHLHDKGADWRAGVREFFQI